MTKEEKLQFIGELTASVKASIIDKVDDMPEEWDGIELRRYIADKFEEQVFSEFRSDRVGGLNRARRLHAYRNECLTRNL